MTPHRLLCHVAIGRDVAAVRAYVAAHRYAGVEWDFELGHHDREYAAATLRGLHAGPVRLTVDPARLHLWPPTPEVLRALDRTD